MQVPQKILRSCIEIAKYRVFNLFLLGGLELLLFLDQRMLPGNTALVSGLQFGQNAVKFVLISLKIESKCFSCIYRVKIVRNQS
jgi:hypothetical protein